MNKPAIDSNKAIKQLSIPKDVFIACLSLVAVEMLISGDFPRAIMHCLCLVFPLAFLTSSARQEQVTAASDNPDKLPAQVSSESKVSSASLNRFNDSATKLFMPLVLSFAITLGTIWAPEDICENLAILNCIFLGALFVHISALIRKRFPHISIFNPLFVAFFVFVWPIFVLFFLGALRSFISHSPHLFVVYPKLIKTIIPDCLCWMIYCIPFVYNWFWLLRLSNVLVREIGGFRRQALFVALSLIPSFYLCALGCGYATPIGTREIAYLGAFSMAITILLLAAPLCRQKLSGNG